MKRIGIAASHIAKEDIRVYNLYVLILSFLVSLVVFCVATFFLIIGFVLLSFVVQGFVIVDPGAGISRMFTVCLVALAGMTAILNVIAVAINIKLR